MTRQVSIVLLAVVASACGYALAGRGNSLPDHVRRIGIPIFDNQSATPELDRVLTDAVRQEFQSRGRYLIVESTTGVDAVLTATLRPLTFSVAAMTDARQASRYLITLQAAVEFKVTRDNSVFWTNPSMRVSEEYEVTGSAGVNDPSALFSQDQNALTRLAKVFARSVVSSILEAF